MSSIKAYLIAAVTVALLSLLAVGTVNAFKPLVGIVAWEQQCGELVAEDGGYSGQTAITAVGGGFNSVVCSNLTSNAVYFGGSTVAAADGYPVCDSESCAGKTLSIDTSGKRMYCATAADLDGGYQPLRCLAGK